MKFPNDKTFKHGEGTGDIVYSFPTVMALGGGEYHIWIGHDRTSVAEVMELQPYITKVHIFKGDQDQYNNLKVDYNLDDFRQQNFNRYILIKCHLLAFGVEFDLASPFLFNIQPKRIAPIIINHTGDRTPGVTVDFSVLKPYEKYCRFVGHKNEHENFVKKYNLNIEGGPAEDILEFAQVIKGSDLYISNQSLGFAMAEGMKHPRVLDVYEELSKQHPQGPDGYEHLSEEIINRYLK